MTISQHFASSSTESRQAAVVSTTVIHLQAREAQDFADYLESQDLAEVLLEQRVLNYAVLKDPSSDGFFLDHALIAQASPTAVQWLRDHQCHRFSGCRVALYTEAVIDDLLSDYEGGQWDAQGYTVIAASALEISIALELRECSCILQLELPGAGYCDTAMTSQKQAWAISAQ